MELLAIHNKNGEPTGKSIIRGNKNLKDDEYIKLAVLWIKCNDKFLIQKTSLEKGNEFAVTGGHVPFGETSLTQACIEAEEELGLIINPNEIVLVGTLTFGHGIFDIYLYENNNLQTHNFVLQESEVESIEFLTKHQIDELIKQDKFRKTSAIQFEDFIRDLK